MTAPKRPTVTCAAPGCDGPVTRGGPGRPRIYCTPACRPNATRPTATRPTATRPTATTSAAPGGLSVEVDHEPVPDNTRPTGRIWKVQLQRAGRTVVIATDLGRPSADHLATQINELLNPTRPAHGGAID